MRGRIAGTEAAHALGHLSTTLRDHLVEADRRALRRALHARPWLDRLFEPAARVLAPDDDEVVVCRCEMVTAGEVRGLAAMGCVGPNQGKTFSRCGMGACQGRMCGLPVSALLARHSGRTPGQVGHYRQRPPIKPVTVAEMANLQGLGDRPAGPRGSPM